MKCPTCPDSTLVMADRSGIEIDYCPACRGVWLDRGELDKIIERSAAPAAPPVMAAPAGAAMPAPMPAPRDVRRRDDDDDDDWRDRDPKYGKKKKRSSFFGEIFDF